MVLSQPLSCVRSAGAFGHTAPRRALRTQVQNSGDEKDDNHGERYQYEARRLGLLRANFLSPSAIGPDRESDECDAREDEEAYVEGPFALAVGKDRQGRVSGARQGGGEQLRKGI